jgi:hypothetical protein
MIAFVVKRKMPGTGVELSNVKSPKTPFSKQSGAKSGAHNSQKPFFEPDLAKVIHEWPKLSKAEKSEITKIINRHEEHAV